MRGRAAVVIPARDEEQRVAATVRAAATLPGVDLVVVVDDGSRDETAREAAGAGARVVRHGCNRGKGAAMASGAAAVAADDAVPAAPGEPRSLLFLDADLEDTAAATGPLLAPVMADEVDMTIATLPTQSTPGGGHGFVVRLARAGVERATGWTPVQPLSGQRCLTRRAFDAASPLAEGWGVEVGLSIDLLRAGYRVAEVEVPLHHRVSGAGWRAQRHRARQWLGVARALAVRRAFPLNRSAAPARRRTSRRGSR